MRIVHKAARSWITNLCWRAVILAVALAGGSFPGQALARDWHHKGSGVSVPEAVGDMRLGEQRDLSAGKQADVMVQYGTAKEPVTLYVYRAAFPNPALWFERTRFAMANNVGLPVEAVSPRAFTLGGASAPNGLREEADIPGNAPWKSTAVAIAQSGEWIVKARATSQSLDKAGIAAKMDQLLGQIRLPPSARAPLPLAVPPPCSASGELSGAPVQPESSRSSTVAAAAGKLVSAQARGHSGLAADPAAWCRATSAVPAEHASVYRQREGKGWVVLLSDSGLAMSGHVVSPSRGPVSAATFASTPSSVHLVALFNEVPSPEAALTEAALMVVTGKQKGLAEVAEAQPQ